MKAPQTRPIIAILSLLFCFAMIWDILHMPPGHDKTIAVQVLSAITTLLGMILAYYFGATHKGSTSEPSLPKSKTDKMKQVFWDIPSLQLEVSAIPGILITPPIPVLELPDTYPEYEIGVDNTDIQVLMVLTEEPVTITVDGVNYTSAVAEFIGGKPRRPR